jgi:hypothetical protein
MCNCNETAAKMTLDSCAWDVRTVSWPGQFIEYGTACEACDGGQ